MKKILFTVVFLAVMLPDTTVANASSGDMTTVQTEQKRRKKFRKKRGFMWGLFRKKDKGCGCPNLT